MLDLRDADVRRFWSYVDIKGDNECWLWTGAKTHRGYGQVSLKGKKYGAHVAAFIIENDHMPTKEVIMHTCDIPLCCNPNHLVDATHRENMEDCAAKGRKNNTGRIKGEKQPNSKLTNEIVLEIRKDYATRTMTLQKIGDKYGISLVMVHYIVTRKSWSHI